MAKNNNSPENNPFLVIFGCDTFASQSRTTNVRTTANKKQQQQQKQQEKKNKEHKTNALMVSNQNKYKLKISLISIRHSTPWFY